MLNGKKILITGGTGSFGKACVKILLNRYNPKKLIIFSRDELKQFEMSQIFSEKDYPCIRYFLGDVRDKERLYRAFDGVNTIIHAAALKQVPAAEYNPFEFVKTNILGAQNIVEAAIDRGVEKVLALSTDKAAAPVNLYGATKLVSDKIFVASNSYSGTHSTLFSVVRYGNVAASRGSVIPFFLKQIKKASLTITDERMTRFWITKKEAVEFSLNSLEVMRGGELFVPKIPSVKVTDIAKAIAPDMEYEVVGIRPGEKLHEVMVTSEMAKNTRDMGDYYVVNPEYYFKEDSHYRGKEGKAVKENFRYASDLNNEWLSVEQIKDFIAKYLNGEEE